MVLLEGGANSSRNRQNRGSEPGARQVGVKNGQKVSVVGEQKVEEIEDVEWGRALGEVGEFSTEECLFEFKIQFNNRYKV